MQRRFGPRWSRQEMGCDAHTPLFTSLIRPLCIGLHRQGSLHRSSWFGSWSRVRVNTSLLVTPLSATLLCPIAHKAAAFTHGELDSSWSHNDTLWILPNYSVTKEYVEKEAKQMWLASPQTCLALLNHFLLRVKSRINTLKSTWKVNCARVWGIIYKSGSLKKKKKNPLCLCPWMLSCLVNMFPVSCTPVSHRQECGRVFLICIQISRHSFHASQLRGDGCNHH